MNGRPPVPPSVGSNLRGSTSSTDLQSETPEDSLVVSVVRSTLDRLTETKKSAYKGMPDEQSSLFRTDGVLETTSSKRVQGQTFSLAGDVGWLRPPQIKPRRRTVTLIPIQEWEGHVVNVTPTHMVANLCDLTAGSKLAEEEATIPIDELTEADAANLRIGQVFRWVIGYQKSPTGTKMRVSQIVFRQLPQWSTREIEEAKAEAHEMALYLNLDVKQEP
jgi:hypothetical protein